MASKLDLHGYKVHNAWKEFSKHVQQCYLDNTKTTTIITGHGKIAEEILAWGHANQYCKTVQLDGRNTGAYIVHIRKNNRKKTNEKAEKPKLDLSALIKKFNNH